MQWEDLPESQYVEDRRGEVFQKTFTIEDVMKKDKKLGMDFSPGDPTSQLARDLGVDDIQPNVVAGMPLEAT